MKVMKWTCTINAELFMIKKTKVKKDLFKTSKRILCRAKANASRNLFSLWPFLFLIFFYCQYYSIQLQPGFSNNQGFNEEANSPIWLIRYPTNFSIHNRDAPAEKEHTLISLLFFFCMILVRLEKGNLFV